MTDPKLTSPTDVATTDERQRAGPPVASARAKSAVPRGERGRWSVNWRTVAITLLVLAVVVPTGHFWQRYQAKRNSNSFLLRAEELEQEAEALASRPNANQDLEATLESRKKFRQAAQLLRRYLQIQPHDVDTSIRMAKDVDRYATSPDERSQVLETYQRVLFLAPDRLETRGRVAELHLELRHFREALQQAEVVLKSAPNDAAALAVQARALDAQSQTGQLATETVTSAYLAALEQAPHDVSLTHGLGMYYRHAFTADNPEKHAALADALFEKLVVGASKDHQAWLARYHYRQQFGLLGADDDLDAAAALAPEEFAVMLPLATRAAGKSKLKNATNSDHVLTEQLYRQMMERFPHDPRGYLGLAQVLTMQDQRPEAISVLEAGLKSSTEADLGIAPALANLYLTNGQANLAEKLVTRIRARTDLISSRLEPAQRLQVEATVNLLEAGVSLSRGKYAESIKVLSKVVASQPVGDREDIGVQQHAKAWEQIGRCEMALRNFEKSAAAFERCASLDTDPGAMLLLAKQAHELNGNHSEARRCLEQALAVPESSSQLSAVALGLTLQDQLALPPEQRNWDGLNEDLKNALLSAPTDPELKLVQAQVLALQGDTETATSLLSALAENSDKDRSIQRRVVLFMGKLRQFAAADHVVATWGASPDGTQFEDILVQVELACQRGDFTKALQLLDNWQPPPGAVKVKRDLLLVTSKVHWRFGDEESARKTLATLLQSSPEDVEALQFAAELALSARDLAGAEAIERQLLAAEGKDGLLWRDARVQRLLAVDKLTKDQEQDVEALLTAINTARPRWPNGPALQAQLAQKRQQPNEAIEFYIRAVELGEQRVRVFQELIGLLRLQDRLVEAQQYDEKLAKLNSARSDWSSSAILGFLRDGEPSRAVKFARDDLEKDTNDAIKHLWLVQTLALNKELPEAESVLRAALKQFPDDTRVWLAAVSYFRQAAQTPQAEALMTELAENPAFSAVQRELTLAQCSEMLSDQARAKAHYLEARRLAPDDRTVLERSATFFATFDPDEAERSLRHLVKLFPQATSPRQSLASVLASRATEAAWQEAWQLLAGMEVDHSDNVANKRLKALLLLRRGSPENRAQARQLMDEVVNRPGAVLPNDRVFLAKLYEQESPQQAREQLELAVAGPNPAGPHMAALADLLLRQGDSAAADPWLGKLAISAPDSMLTLRLRVESLVKKGEEEAIAELVDSFLQTHLPRVNTPAEQARLHQEVAQLYNHGKLVERAEAAYRAALELQPQNYQPLAGFLAEHNRTSEAVALCVGSASTPPVGEDVSTLCLILCRGKPSVADAHAAEPMLSLAQQDEQTNPNLLCAIATWRYINNEQPAALQLFQRVLKQDPDHMSALNNLANMLSEQPETCKEARKYIEHAIELRGPHANLLDTLGVILLRQGETDQAVQTLTEATAAAQPDPRYFFHLALAYSQLGDKAKARKTLQQAQEARLDELVLSKLEKEELSSLRQQLSKG